MMFRLPSVSGIALSFLLCASLVSAYSFVFTNNPQQCATLSLQISGSGVPPYSVLIVPYGDTPLANGVEVRTVISQQFSGSASSLSLPLNYPANSQFVAVVSDSSGFGTGGTSGVLTVSSSTNSGCFNPTQTIHPDFFYNLSPNSLVECSASLLWWDPSTVQGNVNAQGVIPGGESFSIPVGTLTNAPPGDVGTGFNWTPALPSGTTVLVVAGDQRGLGTGGSAVYVVSAGSSSSCITGTSPVSTAGPPAGSIVTTTVSGGGGSVPTSPGGGSTGGGSTGGGSTGGTSGGTTTGGGTISSKELAAIVGGSVGGLAAIIGLGFIVFFIRRNNKPDVERPVDLIPDHGERPQPRHPLPFPDERPETSYYVTSPTISSSFSHSKTPSMTQSVLDSGVRYSMAGSTTLSDAFTGSPTQGSASLNRQSGATSFSDPPSPTRPDLGFGLGVLPEESVTTSGSSSLPKQPMLTILRPVDIIQHEDAGNPSSAPKDTQGAGRETIELPPAYTRIS